MTVRLLTNYPPFRAGNLFSADAATESALVAQSIASTNLAGGTTLAEPIGPRDFWQSGVGGADDGGDWTRLMRDYTLTARDSSNPFLCAGSISIVVPQGLWPCPTVFIMPPAFGMLTVVGQAKLNGSAQNLTRTLAANLRGVFLTPSTDGYTLSGT